MALPFATSDPPRHLYKYLSAERVDVLENAMIRFTQPSVLNDPFEHAAKLDGLFPRRAEPDPRASAPPVGPEQLIRQLFGLALKTVVAAAEQYIRPGWADTHGALSLAAEPDNLLMWAHYADEHRGFVLEFDTSDPFFGTGRRSESGGDDPPNEARAVAERKDGVNEVRYVDERPVLSLEEYHRAVLYKSPQWSYEREWRLIRPLSEADLRLDTAGPAVHLFRFPPESVSAVILGCEAPEPLRRRVADLLITDARYARARLLFAVQHPDRYALRLAGEGWLHLQRALGAADDGDEHATFAHLERAIDVEPENASFRYLRGVMKMAKHDMSGARSDLEASVELNPLSSPAWSALHSLALASGDRKRAREAIDRAIEVDRKDAALYRMRAAMLFEQADYVGAIRDSTRAIATEPDDVASVWRRASAQAKIGDWQAALADTDRAITLAPANVKFHRARAQALRRLGQTDAAEEAERRARALHASLADADSTTHPPAGPDPVA